MSHAMCLLRARVLMLHAVCAQTMYVMPIIEKEIDAIDLPGAEAQPKISKCKHEIALTIMCERIGSDINGWLVIKASQ